MIYKNKPYLCDMETSKDYIAEDFTATIPVADYIAHYRDAEKFILPALPTLQYLLGVSSFYFQCRPISFPIRNRTDCRDQNHSLTSGENH